ncbi:MAG TPA: GFA family protein [Xanthobacteraceae bacterium]
MKQTYAGGCQCGKVRYEVAADLAEVMACNCSRCAKLGWLLAFVPAADFKLIAGEGGTTDYQFNKHVIHHLFCSTCGIESFARGKGPGGVEMAAVNVRCLDGVDLGALKVKNVDGRSL